MKVTNNEFRGFTDFVRLSYVDLQAIGTGLTKQIGNIPIGGSVELVGVVNSIDIAGSSSLVVDVGVSGTAGAFIASWDVDAATVGLPVYNTGTLFVQAAGNTTIAGGSLPVKAVSAATPILLKVTDAALASITAGEIVVVFRILDPLNLNQ